MFFVKLKSPDNLTPAILWCFDNINDSWWTKHQDANHKYWASVDDWLNFYKNTDEIIHSDRIFKFCNSQDAMLFKLRWG
jgi:hypothetical protein